MTQTSLHISPADQIIPYVLNWELRLNGFLARHLVNIFIRPCVDPEGVGAGDPNPPEISQKYRVS